MWSTVPITHRLRPAKHPHYPNMVRVWFLIGYTTVIHSAFCKFLIIDLSELLPLHGRIPRFYERSAVFPPDTGLHAGWMFAIRHPWSPAVRSMVRISFQWFQVFLLGCFTRLSPCVSGEVTSCWQSECFNMFQLLICGKICHRLAPTASSCGQFFGSRCATGYRGKCDLWVWERVILCWWIGIPMTTISNKPDRMLTPITSQLGFWSLIWCPLCLEIPPVFRCVVTPTSLFDRGSRPAKTELIPIQSFDRQNGGNVHHQEPKGYSNYPKKNPALNISHLVWFPREQVAYPKSYHSTIGGGLINFQSHCPFGLLVPNGSQWFPSAASLQSATFDTGTMWKDSLWFFLNTAGPDGMFKAYHVGKSTLSLGAVLPIVINPFILLASSKKGEEEKNAQVNGGSCEHIIYSSHLQPWRALIILLHPNTGWHLMADIFT